MKHKYYASTEGVPTSVLIADAISDARKEHGWTDWALESVDEFHSEVTDERGNVVDVEAKVVVRKV